MLTGDEAHHCVRVLRMHEGEELTAIDGAGCAYRARILHADRAEVECVVLERLPGLNEPRREVVLGMALLKHSAKFDIVVEKAVELGISAIVPLVVSRCETPRGKVARWREIAASAAKQSLRCRIPEITEPMPLEEVCAWKPFGAIAIAHEVAPREATLTGFLAGLDAAQRERMLLLIGPEGGFTDDECVQAERAGASRVSLGPRRLRAETAAILCAGLALTGE